MEYMHKQETQLPGIIILFTDTYPEPIMVLQFLEQLMALEMLDYHSNGPDISEEM